MVRNANRNERGRSLLHGQDMGGNSIEVLVGGGWRLAVGGWWLVAVGSWPLAVGR